MIGPLPCSITFNGIVVFSHEVEFLVRRLRNAPVFNSIFYSGKPKLRHALLGAQFYVAWRSESDEVCRQCDSVAFIGGEEHF